mgnify:FL=1
MSLILIVKSLQAGLDTAKRTTDLESVYDDQNECSVTYAEFWKAIEYANKLLAKESGLTTCCPRSTMQLKTEFEDIQFYCGECGEFADLPK